MILTTLEREALARIHESAFDSAYLNQEPLLRLHDLRLIQVDGGVLILTKLGEDVVRLLSARTGACRR